MTFHCNASRCDNEPYEAYLLYVKLALVEAAKQPVLQDGFEDLTHVHHMVNFAIKIDENVVKVCNAEYVYIVAPHIVNIQLEGSKGIC